MNKLQGIIPPLVTPLLDDYQLDVDGLERLVEHVAAGGVHGVFILGTTGEGPSLSGALKRGLIKRTCRLLGKRLPVLVGITDTAFPESVALAEHAAQCGARAVVVAPPYYFAPAAPELIEYFEHLAPKLPLPFFIYNMPAMTKVDMSPATVAHLATLPGAAGYKDSSGNMVNFHQVMQTLGGRDDFSIMVGPEELLAESVLFGGDGGIAGGANLKPSLYVDMYNAARGGDLPAIQRLQKEIYTLRAVYLLGRYPASSIIKGIKGALAEMDICSDTMAQPFHAFKAGRDRAVLRRTLRRIGLLD